MCEQQTQQPGREPVRYGPASIGTMAAEVEEVFDERERAAGMDVVIFHAGCNDGFCAAWLARSAWPGIECVPAHYGQDPPDVRGKHVLIADFSYKRGVMIGLANDARSLTVLDHHRTAEAELEGLGEECERLYGVPAPAIAFDMEKSGGRLAWEYLRGRGLLPETRPWIVDYTEDRDLWRWALPESRAVNAALSSYPLEFASWDGLAMADLADLADEGRAILRYQSKVVAEHLAKAVEVEIAGHRVPAVNATVLFSEIAGQLAEAAPFGVAYFDRADSKRQFSLRSRGEGGIDVSEVAQRFGGGGHRNAAGFEAMPGEVI